MKIWFTEIGEPLPIEHGARLHRYGQLTKFLATAGHDVTWWTSTFSHAKREFVRAEDAVIEANGVRLRILHGPGYKRSISLARILHQKHFSERFLSAAQEVEKPDLIITPIPTLEVAEAAVQFAKRHKIPVLTDIRDEWPDEFADLAPKQLRPVARAVLKPYYKKARFICENVDGIIGISRRQLEYGLRFASRPQSRNDGIFPLGYSGAISPSGADLDSASSYWRSVGVDPNAFIACLFSTINPFLNLETIIRAASILEKEMHIQFVLCGDGRSLPRMKKLAASTKSVIFPGWVNAAQITTLMEISKVGLAPYAANTRMSLPNKPFEYMAGGLPVLSSIQGEFADIIAEKQCGISYSPESVEEFCASIRTIAGSHELQKRMADNSRKALMQDFSTEKIFLRLDEHLRSVLSRKSAQ